MKKLIVGIVAVVVALGVSVNATFAAMDETEVKESYEKVQAYYLQRDHTLYSEDDIIAVSQLGIDLSNYNIVEDMLKQDFKAIPAGTLSKKMIAFTLMGLDIHNINGFDLVEILQSYVNADGAIKMSDTEVAAPNYAVYCLYALEMINSNSVHKVADHLASTQLENGAFWYEYSGKVADESTTGWVIEALSIVDKTKYQPVIEKAITYLNSVQQSDGSWGNWGASADTQAAVLQGLITYDIEGLKTGKYNKNGVSPYYTLFAFQDSTGWFGYKDFITNEFKKSDLTTFNAASSIGTYFNGSFVLKAKEAYININQKVVVTETPVEKGPATNDTTNVYTYGVLLAISTLVLMRRKYAKV